jgi:hypothetical protein
MRGHDGPANRSQAPGGEGLAMFVRVTIALLACWLGVAAGRAAEEPKAFECKFSRGVTHIYDKGRFARQKAAPLSFGIGAINAPAQTAELKTERGTGTLRMVLAVNATHFIEVVTEGYLNITTIFDKDDAKGAFPAVHSRHLGLLGQPIVTQYQGFCEGKG